MFKKSVRKIVATVVATLVLFFGATIVVIYFSSYADMKKQSGESLDRYVANYSLNGFDDEFFPPPAESGKEPLTNRPKEYELSTFYSVAFSPSGEVLKVDDSKPDLLSVSELTEKAAKILSEGKIYGTDGALSFKVSLKKGYTLVAFIDDSMMKGNMSVLLKYMLIVGGAGIVLVFAASVVIAKKIVKPLEENDKKQKRFVSDAGHELKTPVSVINANAELLKREIGDNKWLDNITYESERMGTLVKELLELSRAENFAPTMEVIDFSRLITGEILPFYSVAFEKGIIIKENVEENAEVYGNPTQLKQLTSILIDNAVKHGEGKEILITLTKSKKNIIFSVENDGKAIPKEQADKIFERFYRLDESRTDNGNNYGLGLAIAKAIAEANRGNIFVKCENGKVKFSVLFPNR